MKPIKTLCKARVVSSTVIALGNAVVALGSVSAQGKPTLTIRISDAVVKEKGLHAGNMVRELAKAHLKGGGGGQPFFATAGGSDSGGLEGAVEAVKEMV